MAVYPQWLYYLEQLGFAELFLPFVLFFGVIYAVLSRIDLFKDQKIRLVISLALSLLVVLPHATGSGYPGGFDPVNALNEILPSGILITLIVFLALVIFGIVGGGTKVPSYLPTGLMALAFIAFLLVAMKAVLPAFAPGWLDWLSDPSLQALIVVITIAGIVIWYISTPATTTADTPEQRKTKRKAWIQEWFGE